MVKITATVKGGVKLDGRQIGRIERDGTLFRVVMDDAIFTYRRITGVTVERARYFDHLSTARHVLANYYSKSAA